MWLCLTMRFPIHCPGCVSWLKKMPGFPILGDQAIKPIFQRPTLESGSTPGLAYVESVECQKKGMVTHVVKSLINHPPVITCHHHFDRWYVYHSQSWMVYGIVLPTSITINHYYCPLLSTIHHC